jgi:hypothetical protein
MTSSIRTIIPLCLLAVMISGCDKAGTIHHKVRYTTTAGDMKSSESKSDDLHTYFGTYITSLTPHYFGAKMNVMCYQDHWNHQDESAHMISYIDGHDNDPAYEIALYADFSGNKEVAIEPILYSTDKWEGVFLIDEVTMNYFCFVPYYMELEVELPGEYVNVGLSQFGEDLTYDNQSGKLLLKTTTQRFEMPVFLIMTGKKDLSPFGYVFGGTNSTWVYNVNGETIADPDNYPFSDIDRPVVRSNKYTPLTVQMPEPGENFEMYSTISYNTSNIIQIYAGGDNTPYTSDDIFVFPPDYWERINVKLEIR